MFHRVKEVRFNARVPKPDLRFAGLLLRQFSAALESIRPNFAPRVLQGDQRFSHAYYDMSNGADALGPGREAAPSGSPAIARSA